MIAANVLQKMYKLSNVLEDEQGLFQIDFCDIALTLFFLFTSYGLNYSDARRILKHVASFNVMFLIINKTTSA